MAAKIVSARGRGTEDDPFIPPGNYTIMGGRAAGNPSLVEGEFADLISWRREDRIEPFKEKSARFLNVSPDDPDLNQKIAYTHMVRPGSDAFRSYPIPNLKTKGRIMIPVKDDAGFIKNQEIWVGPREGLRDTTIAQDEARVVPVQFHGDDGEDVFCSSCQPSGWISREQFLFLVELMVSIRGAVQSRIQDAVKAMDGDVDLDPDLYHELLDELRRNLKAEGYASLWHKVSVEQYLAFQHMGDGSVELVPPDSRGPEIQFVKLESRFLRMGFGLHPYKVSVDETAAKAFLGGWWKRASANRFLVHFSGRQEQFEKMFPIDNPRSLAVDAVADAFGADLPAVPTRPVTPETLVGDTTSEALAQRVKELEALLFQLRSELANM